MYITRQMGENLIKKLMRCSCARALTSGPNLLELYCNVYHCAYKCDFDFHFHVCQ